MPRTKKISITSLPSRDHLTKELGLQSQGKSQQPYPTPTDASHVFETMKVKPVEVLIGEYIDNYATERERFIYFYLIGLKTIVYDEEYKYVLNYPGKVVARQTFIAHKKKFTKVLDGLLLKSGMRSQMVKV